MPHKRYRTRYPLKCYSLCLHPSGKSAYRWCTCSCLHIKLGYKKITRHRQIYTKQLYNQSSLESSTFALQVNTQKVAVLTSNRFWRHVVKWKNLKRYQCNAGKSFISFVLPRWLALAHSASLLFIPSILVPLYDKLFSLSPAAIDQTICVGFIFTFFAATHLMLKCVKMCQTVSLCGFKRVLCQQSLIACCFSKT